MKRAFVIASVLSFSLIACKKEKKEDSAGKDDQVAASGSGSASASGSAAASGSGSATAPAVVDDGAVTLVWKTPAVGSKQTKEEVEHTDLDFSGVAVVVDKEKKRTVEILESGEFVDKVKVHYTADHATSASQGKSKVETSPVEGKTYVVSHQDKTIVATHEDGSPVSPEELDEVTDNFHDELGQRQGVVEVLLAHSWKKGEVVTLEAADLDRLSADMKEGSKVESATISLAELDGTTATIAIELHVTATGKVEGKTTAKITATVDTTTLQASRLEVDHEVAATAKGKAFTGKGHVVEQYTYE